MATGRAASVARRSASKARNTATKNAVTAAGGKSGLQKQVDLLTQLKTAQEQLNKAKTPVNNPPEGQSVMERYGFEAGQDVDFGAPGGAGGKLPGETDKEARARILGSNFSLAGSGGGAVVSNASLVENQIPQMNQKAGGLYGTGSTFGDGGDSLGGYGGEDDFGALLGLTDKKKKKKQEDAFTTVRSEDPYIDAQMKMLEQMQKSQDRATREYISRTRESFNEREAQQQASNESGLAQVRQALNLGGSSRYAPISSSGIISAKEAQGIQALKALDAEENALIAEIKQAQVDRDYQFMEKKMNLLETVRQEKATAAQELEKTAREAQIQSSRDDALAGLVSQGVTDPLQILNYLNYDDAGNKVGDFTLSEIVSSLKGLNELGGTGIGGLGFELDNKAVGKLIGSGFTAPEITALQKDLKSGASIDDVLAGFPPDMQGALKAAFGVDDAETANLVPGKGAKTPVEERAIRLRLEAKLMPLLNKGAYSEADEKRIKTAIDDFRSAGMGEQEILDTLAGIPPEVNTPYNGMFRDIVVANSDSTDKQTQNISKVSTLLQKGNVQQAMNVVENLAMSEARKLDPDNYMGTGSAQYALKTSKDLAKLLDDAEEVLGPLEGTLEQIKGKLAKSKNPKATAIQAEIVKLTAPMRNQLSGTAVTESETAFLEPLIPSISDTIENLNAKINALDSQALDRYNTTRSMVSLPQVTKEQVIDPKQRVILYSDSIYLPTNGSLDL